MERVGSEEELIELKAIVDGIPDPIILINNEFRIKYINHATLNFVEGADKNNFILGKKCYNSLYSRDYICPYCPLLDHKIENEDYNDAVDLESVPRQGLSSQIIYKINGKNEVLNLNFFPLEKKGKIHSFVEKISYMTKVKEKEEEDLRMRNLASLGIMISGVAHELNNPLTGISLTVQNLQNNLSNFNQDSFAERLDLIQKDLYKAAHIVSDIISFAKPEKTKYTLADIHDTVIKAKESAERFSAQMAKEIRWEIVSEPDMVFYFNPLKIERLFLNLFRNSIQAFDYNEGKIKVQIKKSKGACKVYIEDDAGGIPEDVIDKIFDPFFTNKKDGSGTGLGLSICHSIIKEHNGKINVKSQDKKTTFAISLPFIQEKRATLTSRKFRKSKR